MALLVMALSLTMAGGCADLNGPRGGPSLIDELRSADLGEKRPRAVKQGGDSDKDGSRKFETYPGDDQFRDQTAAGAGKRKAGQSAVQRAGDGYQLSFENASIAEVAKVILGDTLKAPYYYDPRVQGQVTLATGRSVNRDELLSVLETALKMNNAVLINGDGQYRVAPAAEALAGDVGSVVGEQTPGFGVSVLPLRHVSADAMMKLIENFVAKAGSLRAESTGNMLLIRGTARERQSLMEVAATFDVDWLKSQSAGIFPLTHSTPDELIADLTQAMNAEEGDLLGKVVRFQPLHRLNAVLVLARQSSQLKQAAEWIRRLDRDNEAGQDLHVYRVENGRAADLASLLNETLGTGTGGGTRRSREVAPGREVTRLSSRASRPPTGLPLSAGGQRSAQLQPALAPGRRQQQAEEPPPLPPAPAGSGQGPGGGAAPAIRITADEVNNLLLISASPAEYRRIAKVLREIDRPPLQVMINATIVEVTLNEELRYGVQVFLKGRRVSGGIVTPASDAKAFSPIVPNNPGLNFIIGSLTDPKVVLDALAGVTEVKVVSSPSVVVVDNQPAILKVGDEIPVSTQQASILDGNGNVGVPFVNSVQFRDTGVILKVIPRVNSSGLVTMDVEQEVSQVAAQVDTGNLTPTISQRQVASTISVYSGQMVALGGLISEQRNNDRASVPIINQVPLFGDLLGSTGKEVRRTELIVFIRPQVIRDSRDARDATEELRSRVKSLAPPPPNPRDVRRTPAKTTKTGRR